MRIGYADPPYPGCAHMYAGHPDYAGEVDHAALIDRLAADFDGWALSTSSSALRDLLPLCPVKTRVGAWVKPFCSFKPGQTVAWAWEPVLFVPARARPRSEPTVRDWVSCNITLRKGLVGVKPDEVCRWLFEVLGMVPGDELHDLFPGSGAVSRAWADWQAAKAA